MNGLRVIAEGIETVAELQTLRASASTLMQGYLFARPAFEELPSPDLISVYARPRTGTA